MTKPIINRELYFRDPTTLELLNNGVSKVSEIGQDERQIKTLRFELETFVCDGEYARGLDRILTAYSSLQREHVELATMYAEANPQRGRPRLRAALPPEAIVLAQRKRRRIPATA